MCGSPIRQAPKAIVGPTKTCLFCHAVNEKDAPFCSGCGKPMGSVPVDLSEGKIRRERDDARIYTDYATGAVRSSRASTAGILLLVIVAFVAMDMVITVTTLWDFSTTREYDELVAGNSVYETAFANLLACQVIRLMFVVVVVLGAVSAMRRMRFGFAVIGCVFAIFCLGTNILALVSGFWMLVSIVLFFAALVSLGLVIASRREFSI